MYLSKSDLGGPRVFRNPRTSLFSIFSLLIPLRCLDKEQLPSRLSDFHHHGRKKQAELGKQSQQR